MLFFFVSTTEDYLKAIAFMLCRPSQGW